MILVSSHVQIFFHSPAIFSSALLYLLCFASLTTFLPRNTIIYPIFPWNVQNCCSVQCVPGIQFNGLTTHCLHTFVCLLCTWYILASFDGSLLLLWSKIPRPMLSMQLTVLQVSSVSPHSHLFSAQVSSGYSVLLL